ncbi:MAG TPA: acetylxylan esterase, partial [Gemmatimonadaceae bacterium]|nr:acetylxylan esterase [Gemmatimonadaceae bacterium]
MLPTVCHPRLRALVALALLLAPALRAQQPTFTPDHVDGIYAAGERIGWTVTLPPNSPAAGVYSYTIRRFGAESLSAGKLDLRRGRARIETSLAQPAMLVVDVTPPAGVTDFGSAATGGKGHVLLGAAVDPTTLRAAEPKPADFDTFWSAKLRALDSVPMEPVVKPADGGKPGIEYATVRLNNVKSSHVYGQLAKPAREGKFPAILVLQWASPPYPLQKQWVTDLAAQGYLAFNVEPHDVPSDMPKEFYDALP